MNKSARRRPGPDQRLLRALLGMALGRRRLKTFSWAGAFLALAAAAGFWLLDPAASAHPHPPSPLAPKGSIEGRVIGVADGDTLTLLTQTHRGPVERRVRLAGIDAPESHQPFGQRAQQMLASLCFGQPARLDLDGTDRYGRLIAHVYCASNENSANEMLLQAGLAWAYTQYRPPAIYVQAEAEARAARRGLWSDPQPVPPWEWRLRNRRP